MSQQICSQLSQTQLIIWTWNHRFYCLLAMRLLSKLLQPILQLVSVIMFCTAKAQQISFLACNCFCFNQVYVHVDVKGERASNKCPNTVITTLIAGSCALAEPIISTIHESNEIPAAHCREVNPSMQNQLQNKGYIHFQGSMPNSLLTEVLSQKR